jgi:hypothetical protein
MLLPQGAPVTLIDDVGKMVVALLFTGAGCWTRAPKALVSDLWLSMARDAATHDQDGCYAGCRKKQVVSSTSHPRISAARNST